MDDAGQQGMAVLLTLGREALTALMLSSARLTAILLILPPFSRSLIPGLVRTGIAFGLVAIVVPPVFADPTLRDLDLYALSALALKESAIGFLMGLTFSTAFLGVEAAGFFIDNHRGAAIASSLDPLTGSESAPMGIFFLQV